MPTATLTVIVNTWTPSSTIRVMMTSVHGVTSSQVIQPGEHGSQASSPYYRHRYIHTRIRTKKRGRIWTELNIWKSLATCRARPLLNSALTFASAKEVMFSLCLFVCLLAVLHENYSSDFSLKVAHGARKKQLEVGGRTQSRPRYIVVSVVVRVRRGPRQTVQNTPNWCMCVIRRFV